MRVTATFSDGLLGQLKGRAIGDEFTVAAMARIVGADEALIDVSRFGDEDTHVLNGELEVRLLLSHGKAASGEDAQATEGTGS